MAKTLSQMQVDLAVRTGQQVGNGIFNEKARLAINRAINQFISAASWYFLSAVSSISLVAGTQEYDLAADFDKMNDQGVRLGTTWTQLLYVSERDIDYVIPNPKASGTTTNFGLRGFQKIQLYPIPDAAAVAANATISYEYFRKVSTEMASASSTTIVPDSLLYCPLDLAEHFLASMLGDRDGAQLAIGRYLDGLRMLKENNRKVVEVGVRSLIGVQPDDQRQGQDIDHRRL